MDYAKISMKLGRSIICARKPRGIMEGRKKKESWHGMALLEARHQKLVVPMLYRNNIAKLTDNH